MIIKYNEFLKESDSTYTEKDPEYYGITNYKWNDGLLDCYQNVKLTNKNLTKLPFNFGKIYGWFECAGNPLTNLEGCPKEITHFFYVRYTEITSLYGCPEKINGDFYCIDAKLTSLEYCPKEITGDFYLPKEFAFPFNLDDYPRSIIHGEIKGVVAKDFALFKKCNMVCDIVKNNMDLFRPLLDDKVGFHQMVMRINPYLIQFYVDIPPPSKKTVLFI